MIQGGAVIPDNKELLCYHPHGIMSMGFTHCMFSKSLNFAKSGLSWCMTPQMFKFPISIELTRWTGATPASSDNMTSLMKSNKNLALIPGGFNSATLYTHGEHRCYLKQRKGFIKYGLRYGYKMRPVYVFGEEETYYAYNGFEKLRLWLANRNIPGIIAIGKYGMYPNPEANLNIVVGEPIQFPKISNPTKENVDEWHKQYSAALVKLFNDNKDQYAVDPSKELELL
jgi:2-acylglycerol O-acyltransferase 2